VHSAAQALSLRVRPGTALLLVIQEHACAPQHPDISQEKSGNLLTRGPVVKQVLGGRFLNPIQCVQSGQGQILPLLYCNFAWNTKSLIETCILQENIYIFFKFKTF
jgi:hypothetical protein